MIFCQSTKKDMCKKWPQVYTSAYKIRFENITFYKLSHWLYWFCQSAYMHALYNGNFSNGFFESCNYWYGDCNTNAHGFEKAIIFSKGCRNCQNDFGNLWLRCIRPFEFFIFFDSGSEWYWDCNINAVRFGKKQSLSKASSNFKYDRKNDRPHQCATFFSNILQQCYHLQHAHWHVGWTLPSSAESTRICSSIIHECNRHQSAPPPSQELIRFPNFFSNNI